MPRITSASVLVCLLALSAPTAASFWDYLGMSSDVTDVHSWKPDDEFTCVFHNDSVGTVDQFDLCNGNVACKDGQDESDVICRALERCPPGKRRCPIDGDCLQASQLCDGVSDCVSDSWDERAEAGCSVEQELICPENRLFCPENSKCLELEVICDFKNDCDDGSDESPETCPTGKQCPEGNYHCYKTDPEMTDFSLHCIPQEEACNRIADCPNAEDELPDKSPCTLEDLKQQKYNHGMHHGHIMKIIHHNTTNSSASHHGHHRKKPKDEFKPSTVKAMPPKPTKKPAKKTKTKQQPSSSLRVTPSILVATTLGLITACIF